MLNPDDPNVRLAQFGRQVELFLEGDIGRYLLRKAGNQIDEGMVSLRRADPYKPEEVQTAQNQVLVAESIIDWLGQAITEGQQAMEELKNAQISS